MGAVTTTSPVAFRNADSSADAARKVSGGPPPPPQVALGAADRAVVATAEHALLDERRLLAADELRALAALPDGAVMALAALAHQVRLAWCGPEVEIEGILSAKTGGCPEDCHFCAQSSRFDTPVKATPFLDTDEVLDRRPRDRRPRRLGVLHRARRPRAPTSAPSSASSSWSPASTTRPV